jgi:two-component system, sensor histidine kinase
LNSPHADGRSRALRWLGDRPVTTKLVAMTVAFVLVILAILAVVAAALDTTAGVRGYVRGEGLWSRSQKEAAYNLSLYVEGGRGIHWQRYRDAIAIPLGDHQARVELQKPEFDLGVVTRGFEQGLNEPADIPSMIRLFRRFQNVSYFADAVHIWTEADTLIAELDTLAAQLHAEVQAGTLDAAARARYQAQIEALNAELTPLEHEFSATLGHGARFINDMLLGGIVALTALLLGVALWLAWRIAHELRRAIFNLRDGALRVAAGDLVHLIPQLSRDELGDLTDVFNQMIQKRREAEFDLREHAEELARSNAELERFAYVASHDLQEPLRTVTSYTQLLLRRYADKSDAEAREFSAYIVEAAQRMRELIDGLLSFSRVSEGADQPVPTDLNESLRRALANLDKAIADSGAVVTTDSLPTLPVQPQLMVQLFQNLVGNALKFRGKAAPEIRINATRETTRWLFEVCDNGIGIEPRHAEKVFVLFQRLHTRERFPGSGLGLAICRKIVERHGGRIWLEPAEKGACFRFTLPLA